MFAVGSAIPIPIDYNGQKCSIGGDTESLRWYCIGFIWENTICCSPQALASQYVSFSVNDSLKHSQALHPLSCANRSFHEVGLLAETMNQCRLKIPQREKPLFSSQVSSVILVAVQPHKELCQLSCAWRWCEGTHARSWDRDAHQEPLALLIWVLQNWQRQSSGSFSESQLSASNMANAIYRHFRAGFASISGKWNLCLYYYRRWAAMPVCKM